MAEVAAPARWILVFPLAALAMGVAGITSLVLEIGDLRWSGVDGSSHPLVATLDLGSVAEGPLMLSVERPLGAGDSVDGLLQLRFALGLLLDDKEPLRVADAPIRPPTVITRGGRVRVGLARFALHRGGACRLLVESLPDAGGAADHRVFLQRPVPKEWIVLLVAQLVLFVMLALRGLAVALLLLLARRRALAPSHRGA